MTRYMIRKGLRRHKLVDERKAAVAVVRRNWDGYTIDAGRNGLYSVREGTELTLEVCRYMPGGGRSVGRAGMTLEENESALLPSRAATLHLHLEGEVLTLVRARRRGLHIVRRGEVLGEITGMLGLRPRLTLKEAMHPGWAALLYALALRMLEEDDAPLV